MNIQIKSTDFSNKASQYLKVVSGCALSLTLAQDVAAWSIASDDGTPSTATASGTGYSSSAVLAVGSAEAIARTWDATAAQSSAYANAYTELMYERRFIKDGPADSGCTFHYTIKGSIEGRVDGNAVNGAPFSSGSCNSSAYATVIGNAPGWSDSIDLNVSGNANESGGFGISGSLTGAGISFSGGAASYGQSWHDDLDKEDNTDDLNAFVKVSYRATADSSFSGGADGPNVGSATARANRPTLTRN